ncbi:MerR family transcriptional regulator [Nonomuraea thailandensis]
MDGDTLYSIGDLARRTGLTVKTVRFYSDAGIVPPTCRSHAGYRLYDRAAAAASTSCARCATSGSTCPRSARSWTGRRRCPRSRRRTPRPWRRRSARCGCGARC